MIQSTEVLGCVTLGYRVPHDAGETLGREGAGGARGGNALSIYLSSISQLATSTGSCGV